jgi:K+-sensing histidine kinase KdpD
MIKVPPHSDMALSGLLAYATANLQKPSTEGSIDVNLAGDAQLSVQNPELLAYVLMTLVDNAFAYNKVAAPLQTFF